jgi:tRNA pseudouridine55 synthase
MIDGILNINKPSGETSYSLVAMVKRLSGERHVGHAGTLDPGATGVLPICIGRGTRIVEFLMETTKAYRAEIELGKVTDTYDASGRVIELHDAATVSRTEVELALNTFRGTIQQKPPVFSAVKHQGRALYHWARAGIDVKPESRLAQVHSLEIIDWQPPVATIEVVCGKGTYIRSLAYDLGRSLGCGAHLKSLVRLRYGPFDIKDAISAYELQEACRHGYWHRFVHPVDSVLSYWSAMIVNYEREQSIRHGQSLILSNRAGLTESRCRAYTLDGYFLGVLRFNAEQQEWQPEKVFL